MRISSDPRKQTFPEIGRMLGLGWPEATKRDVKIAYGYVLEHRMHPDALIVAMRQRGHDVSVEGVLWYDELVIVSCNVSYFGPVAPLPRAIVVKE